MPRRPTVAPLLCVAAYLALAVVCFWHVWTGHPTSDMQLGGDQWRNVWFLAWVPHALGHGLDPLYSSFANVPTGVNLVAGAGVPVLGLVFAPITVWWGPIAAFNVVATLALAGSATAGMVLMRRFTTWWPAAFVGGLLYGFSPAVIAQSMDGHINLSFVVLPPIILLVVHDLVDARTPHPARRGVVLGLLVSAQFLISSEILFDTAVVAGVGVGVIALQERHRVGSALGRLGRGLGPATVTSGALLAWPLWVLVAGPAHISGKLQLIPQAYRADVAGLVIPDSNQLLRIHALTVHADHFSNTPGENGAYLGVGLLAVLLVAVLRLRRSRVAMTAAVVGIAAWVLSLGGALTVVRAPAINGAGAAAGSIPLPGAIFSHLPLLVNVVPGRYGIFVDLAAALVVAILLDSFVAAPARERPAGRTGLGGWRRAGHGGGGGTGGAYATGERLGTRAFGLGVPAVLAALALIPLIPRMPFVAIGDAGTPPAYRSDKLSFLRPGVVALNFPYPSNAYPQPSLWQAESWFRFRMPGGYFLVPQGEGHHVAFSGTLGYASDTPTGEMLTALAAGRSPARTAVVRGSIEAQLRAWGVTVLIATPSAAANPAAASSFLRWLAGAPQHELSGGTAVWTSLPRP